MGATELQSSARTEDAVHHLAEGSILVEANEVEAL